MNRYLSVIETPYRAVHEEQCDTGLWFTHALRNAEVGVGVLLRGNAVVYGIQHQQQPRLTLGMREVAVGPNGENEIRALMANRVTVYIVVDDAAERGIFKDDMIPGLQHLPRGWLGKLYDSYQRIIHW